MHRPPICIVLVIIGLFQFPLVAAAIDVDEFRGHLTRADDHRPVAGAKLTLKESGVSVLTGNDGAFSFAEVAPGTYTLVIENQGTLTEQRVEIGGRTPSNGELTLGSGVSAFNLESISVVGQKSAAEIARQEQQYAPNLINVTMAEEIEKLPDVNAAEAVRRLPGISLETDTGEGRYINIRGIDSELNSTTFDGLRLASQDNASGTGGGRAVAMDAIPAGIIGSITVTKTNRPDQDAEALGGTIEITSRAMPQGKDFFVDGHAGTGYEPLRHTGIVDGEIAAGFRFGPADLPIDTWSSFKDRPFSFVLSTSYYADKRGIDDLEEGYVDNQSQGIPDRALNAIEQRYYQHSRKRHGFGMDFEYQPDARNSWYLRAFDVGYTELKSDNKLIWSLAGNPVSDPPNPAAFIDSVQSMTKESSLDEERVENKVFILGGKNTLDGDMALDYHFGHSQGIDDFHFDYTADFNYNNLPSNAGVLYNNQSNPSYIGIQPVNFNAYKWNNYSLTCNSIASGNGCGLTGQVSLTNDQENSFGANLRVPEHWTDDKDENLKFGVNARLRDRTVMQTPNSYAVPGNGLTLPLASAEASGPITYYNGAYNNGPNVSISTVLGQIGPQYAYYAPGDILSAQSAYLGAQENVYAAYGQYEFGWSRWTLLAGARVEATRASYESIGQTTLASGAVVSTPDAASNSYNNIFPTLQGRYELRPDLIARGTVSSAIGRPGFQQNTSQTNITIDPATVSVGNPALKPTTGINYDFTIEDYLPHGGILSLGLFDKQFKDYIAETQLLGYNGSFPNGKTYSGLTGISSLTSWINLPASYARGIELNYEQHFKELPGWLGGLGLAANVTFVSSSFEIRPGEYSLLPSTSQRTGNLALMYERAGLVLRLGGYYVSQDLFTIGQSAATDVWSDPVVQVDWGSSYQIDKHWGVYFNAKNLTNYKLEFTENPANRPIQREFYGPTYTAGVSFHFG